MPKLIKKIKRSIGKIIVTIRNPMVVDEHFAPKDGLELSDYIETRNVTAVHSILRYRWALCVLEEISPKGNILDLACGSGFGSFMLARAFPQTLVVGCDYDPKAIQYAQKYYSAPNLRFGVGDGTRWDQTVGAETYDVITSFDTLEHVRHRDIFMENLVSHLHHAGCLLFSTPCGTSTNELMPVWSHHHIEYSSASLFDFIQRYFRQVVRPEDEAFPCRQVFDVLQGTGVNYNLTMNPILCKQPVVFANPYK